jgi:GNAT superfamily N-acetyltransferase
VADLDLATAAGQAWADALGCAPGQLGEAGVHLVPGGARLAGFRGVYLASIGPAVLVYCPDELRGQAGTVLAATPPGELFTVRTCARLAALAGVTGPRVHGPSWHGFTDAAHFRPAVPAAGRRLDRADPLLAGLRAACGDGEWAEGGFAHPDGVVYGIEERGGLVAAGNLTPFRGHPADAGLLTHPEARGRGLATRIAVRMITDALPAAGLVRYRALASNAPSLAIARSLGFAGCGQNLMARLPS